MPLVSKKSLRRGRIVQAAGRLFAYQGYHGTSTRQIAQLASMSENTIFRYFEHKESLFWSTLGAQLEELDLRRTILKKTANCEPPELVLPKILEVFADTASYRPELLRLTLVAFIELHPKGKMFLQEALSPALTIISQYLEMNIKDGRIRELDPATLTLALTMTALTHAEILPLIEKNKPLSNHQEKSRSQAKLWLDMLVLQRPNQASQES